jgi:hypothetical protein
MLTLHQLKLTDERELPRSRLSHTKDSGAGAGIQNGTMDLNWYFCRLNGAFAADYFKL